MNNRYCFWSAVDNHYATMMAHAIASARTVGVFKDFHVWSNRPVPGAVNHRLRNFDKRFGMFKIRLLREKVQSLDYDYFVWLDADSWFVRNPGDLLAPLQRSPVHATFEANVDQVTKKRAHYHGCPLPRYAEIMRHKGVCSRSVFTVNAGFWMVHRDAVETLASLASDFWIYCHKKGFTQLREEPALAYATHMLCGNPYLHTLPKTSNLWAPDHLGTFRRRLPQGQAWPYQTPFSTQRSLVNPAIIHLLHSKTLLSKPSAP